MPANPQPALVRPSACPGLLRIVPALDGGICRVRLACGKLSAAQAMIVADMSTRCASGVIEITNRANLQLRGVRNECASELIDALLAAGLGPAAVGADDVRNLMVSPSAGIDAGAVADVAPLAAEILALLQTQQRFQQLSPKFALLLDGGEQQAMLEHTHDLWLAAVPGAPARFVFGLASCPSAAGALASVEAAQVLALIDAVLNLFLDLATPEQTRMRHSLQAFSTAEFLQQLQRRFPFELRAAVWQREMPQPFAHIGVHAQRQPGLSYVGAVPALGRVSAGQLHELARIAQQHGDGTLRLTPWQSVLLPNIATTLAQHVLTQLRQLDLRTQINDALAHMIACTGARGCAKGLADTKADALQLAQSLNEKSIYPGVHLSGCARSCAAAHTAPFTLLAVADGHYDVFQRDAAHSGFGRPLAAGIGIAQIGELLAATLSTVESTHD